LRPSRLASPAPQDEEGWSISPESQDEHAPAKINLALHVTGRRGDGYHLLDTLVVFAEFGDKISARRSEVDRFELTGRFAHAIAGGDNLVLQSRDLLRKIGGGGMQPVSIRLEKNLPIASGLGGGSSDAAATLKALARLWGLDIQSDDLARDALSLGADLPMCLAARSLIARGIGEEIAPVGGLPPLSLVLVNPGVAVSTPEIFRTLERRDSPPLQELPPRPGLDELVGWLTASRNDLEPAAIAIAPQIADALGALRRSGAALARMSGSGATCFGLYATEAEAARAARQIAAARPGWFVEATRTMEKANAYAAA
jgi:4-diphosphocytidyl-2-C-methyl-D-erythritol kinase